MPDPLKIAALERAGVRVLHTCASCINFVPGAKGTREGVPAWGSCAVVQAAHERHTGGCRASVRADMTCERHGITLAADSDLHASGMDHLRPRDLDRSEALNAAIREHEQSARESQDADGAHDSPAARVAYKAADAKLASAALAIRRAAGL